MAGWRDRKARMLKVVHRTFEVPARYLTHMGGVPIDVLVRIHRKPTIDKLTFGDFSDAAEAWAAEDVIVFDLNQVPRPAPGAFLVVDAEEGYTIGAAKPAQGGYQHVTVTELKGQKLKDVYDYLGQP